MHIYGCVHDQSVVTAVDCLRSSQIPLNNKIGLLFRLPGPLELDPKGAHLDHILLPPKHHFVDRHASVIRKLHISMALIEPYSVVVRRLVGNDYAPDLALLCRFVLKEEGGN